MDQELSKCSNFKDALRHIREEEEEDLFFIQSIGDISEISDFLPSLDEGGPRIGVFFLCSSELILLNATGENYFFHISNPKLSRLFSPSHNIVIRPEKHFPLYVFYILFHIIGSERFEIAKKPFEQNWKTFANRLFYYIESPVDPLILSGWGVELDLTAVNLKKVVQ